MYMQSGVVVGVYFVSKPKWTAVITHSRMVCKSNSPTIMIVEASALYKTSMVGQLVSWHY